MQQSRSGFRYKTLEEALVERANRQKKRVPENPIHVARQYLGEYENGHGMTYRGIARKFGVSQAEVCYHVALVKRLPAGFVAWLERCDDPKVLQVCTERRLRPITRLRSHAERSRAVDALPLVPAASTLIRSTPPA